MIAIAGCTDMLDNDDDWPVLRQALAEQGLEAETAAGRLAGAIAKRAESLRPS